MDIATGIGERGKRRVLLADDSPTFRAALRLYLEEWSELELVGEAVDGEAACRAAVDLQPDVVLMDVRMPRMHGLSAAKRIKGQAASPWVVLFSTNDDDATRNAALAAGADDFISKNDIAGQLVGAFERLEQRLQNPSERNRG